MAVSPDDRVTNIIAMVRSRWEWKESSMRLRHSALKIAAVIGGFGLVVLAMNTFILGSTEPGNRSNFPATGFVDEEYTSGLITSSLNLEAVVEPYELNQAELAAVMADRARYGLLTDPSFIRSLYADPVAAGAVKSGTQLLGGLLLAPNELHAAESRVLAEWDSLALGDAARQVLDSRYLRTEIMQNYLVVYCNECGENELAEIRGLVPEMATPINLNEVDFDVSQLVSEANTLIDEFEAAGIRYVRIGVDETRGIISVQVPSESIVKIERHPSLGARSTKPDVILEETEVEVIGYTRSL